MPRRFVSGHEQCEKVSDRFVRRDGFSLDLGVHDCGRDVVGRFLASSLDVGMQVPEQRRELRHGFAGLVGRLDRRVRPAPELLPIAALDAEQLGDHEHGEGRGYRVDEVDLLTRRDLGEHRSGNVAHARFQRTDGTGSEATGHEPTPRCVFGRVHVQDRARDFLPVPHGVIEEYAAGGGELLRIATHGAARRRSGRPSTSSVRTRIRVPLGAGVRARRSNRARRSFR